MWVQVKECQRLLGFSRGARMMEMVERVTGAPCACLAGERPCILTRDYEDIEIPQPRTESVALAVASGL